MRMSKQSVSILMMIAALMKVVTLICSVVSVALLWKIAWDRPLYAADTRSNHARRTDPDDPEDLDNLCF